eukprot:CAMPEP_0179138654 /NCGR_PEP_ID=MMETSP0796-20121207/66237_1 /TAXON_ID=73915 /ORGANISM="Pyrodinium bahamense, Strain pbaha01" /LENGTH=99 /DNA_ID=CAMNT_0020837963 /DNA_START=137 /DNA_END=437 /DNA_ORIENTATION=-
MAMPALPGRERAEERLWRQLLQGTALHKAEPVGGNMAVCGQHAARKGEAARARGDAGGTCGSSCGIRIGAGKACGAGGAPCAHSGPPHMQGAPVARAAV